MHSVARTIVRLAAVAGVALADAQVLPATAAGAPTSPSAQAVARIVVKRRWRRRRGIKDPYGIHVAIRGTRPMRGRPVMDACGRECGTDASRGDPRRRRHAR